MKNKKSIRKLNEKISDFLSNQAIELERDSPKQIFSSIYKGMLKDLNRFELGAIFEEHFWGKSKTIKSLGLEGPDWIDMEYTFELEKFLEFIRKNEKNPTSTYYLKYIGDFLKFEVVGDEKKIWEDITLDNLMYNAGFLKEPSFVPIKSYNLHIRKKMKKSVVDKIDKIALKELYRGENITKDMLEKEDKFAQIVDLIFLTSDPWEKKPPYYAYIFSNNNLNKIFKDGEEKKFLDSIPENLKNLLSAEDILKEIWFLGPRGTLRFFFYKMPPKYTELGLEYLSWATNPYLKKSFTLRKAVITGFAFGGVAIVISFLDMLASWLVK